MVRTRNLKNNRITIIMMEDIIVTQENVERYSGDAIIRMKDYGEFFGKRIGRMQMVLDIVRECEVMVQYVGVKPEFIIILKPFNALKEDSLRNSVLRRAFYREVVRVGLLIEKLVLLVDPEAKVEVDYPNKDVLIGRTIVACGDFSKECRDAEQVEKCSDSIPRELEHRISDYLDLVIPPQNYMIGICHNYWGMTRSILRHGFGLHWQSPAERNPGVIFD